jgi:2-keto-4-pentenoate hydratase/2-oxohepta-3-ene-1,7-dioic acid hydratase in catechol pathway
LDVIIKIMLSELNHEVQRLYVFTKAASSLTGDNSTIPNHQDITDQLDYEGELRHRNW